MKKRIASVLLAIVMAVSIVLAGGTVAASSTRLPFRDVSESSWYADYVKYLYRDDLMYGKGNNYFAPQSGMTRAEIVTMLSRMAEADTKDCENYAAGYSDIKGTEWHAAAVGWGVKEGILNGYPDGSMKPDTPVLRQEISAIIVRFSEMMKLDLPSEESMPNLKDREDIPEFAEEAVEKLCRAGIIVGDNYGYFNPAKSLTRAEASKILMMFDMIKKAAEETPVPELSYDRKSSEEYKVWGALQLYYAGTGVYSNMSAEIDESADLPELRFKCEEGDDRNVQWTMSGNTAKAPWYAGVSPLIMMVDLDRYPVFAMKYKTDGEDNFGGVFYTDRFTHEFQTVSMDESDGWKKVTVDLRELLDEGETLSADSDNFVRVYFYPFGESGEGSFSMQYAGYFPDEESAEAFNPDDIADYMTTYVGKYKLDWREMTDGAANKYDDAVEYRIDEIREAKDIDPSTISGKCYYVSSINGDDTNDGLSPNSPWKSIKKLYKLKAGNTIAVSIANPGDAVFFERGSVFYGELTTTNSGNTVLDTSRGVTYAAYGEGDKPIFTNAVDINGSMDWSPTEYENVWRLDSTLDKPSEIFIKEPTSIAYTDVGSIVFNGGEGWGIRVVPNDVRDPYKPGVKTENCGMVTNGYEYFHSGDTYFENPGYLQNNLEYFHDWETGILYLYYDKGNPGEEFDSIVIAKRGQGIGGADDVLLDNLSVKHTGAHGISTGSVKNFEVQNCEIGWIGGCTQGDDGKVRYGNAIENWADCDGFYIHECYIYQVYDGTLSSQTGDGNNGTGWQMKDIQLYDNVLTLGNSLIEIWAGDSYNAGDENDVIFKDIHVHDNYMMYTGYHFGHQRPAKNASFNCGSSRLTDNWVMEDNVCLYSSMFANVGWEFASDYTEGGIISHDNVYALSEKINFFYRGYENLTRPAKGGTVIKSEYIGYPYTERYMAYLISLGIEKDSTFYYYSDYLFDEEEFGVYSDRLPNNQN